jgi:hypothetical protein
MTVSVTAFEEAPKVTVIVARTGNETALVVIVKLAELSPAGTVTDVGTLASEELDFSEIV